MRLIKLTFGSILGVTVYEIIISLWQMEEMDWESVVNFSIAGFTGISIEVGLRSVFKKQDV